MSPSNVEIVRSLIEAWNDRDIDALIEMADADIEYVNSPTAVEPGTRRGLDEVVGVFRAQWEALPGAVQVVDRIHDHGDQVIAETRVSRILADSDAQISNRLLFSTTFREGKVVRAEMLGAGSTFDAAREAAGLSDQGG